MKFNNELELIDYVSDKLTEQGCKSLTEDTILCLYRGHNGTKCAAGWLIDDADYTPDMESYPAIDVHNNWGVFQPEYMKTITALQCIHDQYPENMWPEKFAELRASCGSK